MAKRTISLDLKDIKGLGGRLKGAGDAAVNEFIREFLTEMAWRAVRTIKKLTPVNTGLLQNSFQVGEIVQDGDMWTVEIYTDIEYALHVEFGTKGHFTPGRWEGNAFIYDPSAKTGVYFKAQPGRFMMKLGIEQIEQHMQKHFERHAKKWLKKLFGG